MNTFSWLFLLSLTIATILQLSLIARHLRHIKRHQAVVPTPFQEKISLAAHQKAAQYTTEKVRWGAISLCFSFLVTLAWTFGHGLQYLTQHPWLQSLHDYPLTQGVTLLTAFILINALLSLPWDLWSTFHIEAKFGFNRKTVALFVGDLLKESLLFLLLGIPLMSLILWVISHLGTYWWFFAWLFWTGLQFTLMLIYPTFIAPLFNRFEPLNDHTILPKVEALLQRCGFQFQGIFVMDGSKRSTHSNAYFTGLGKNKRVVFYDTLLQRLTPEEIEAVLAHELGHFKRRHILKRIGWSLVFSLLFFFLIAYLIEQPWFFQGLGLDLNLGETPEGTWRSPMLGTSTLLLLSLALPPFFTFLMPLMNYFSRKHEFEADTFAAQYASGPALISALSKLYEDNANTLTPDPLYSMFHDSHPPATLRVHHLQMQAAMGL